MHILGHIMVQIQVRVDDVFRSTNPDTRSSGVKGGSDSYPR